MGRWCLVGDFNAIDVLLKERVHEGRLMGRKFKNSKTLLKTWRWSICRYLGGNIHGTKKMGQP